MISAKEGVAVNAPQTSRSVAEGGARPALRGASLSMPAVPVLRRAPAFRASVPVVQLNGDPKGLPNQLNDCFINAILQLLAGGYAPLFDADENPLGQAEGTELQGIVHQILQKIRGRGPWDFEDPGDVGDNEIMLLRNKLLFHNLVQSQWGQEDAAELLTRLLSIVTDLAGRELRVNEDGLMAIVGYKETLGAFAENVGTEAGELLRLNDDLRLLAQFHFTEVKTTTILKSKENKGTPGTDPGVYTQSKMSSGPVDSTAVEVPIEEYDSLEEFLYYRYGVGEFRAHEEGDEYDAVDDGIAVKVSESRVSRRFLRLPPTMTFQVRRSSVNEEGEQVKIEKEFHMPEHLVLREENGKMTSYKAYMLTGVVEHISFIPGEMGKGHYVAHIKGDKQWHTADDRSVTGRDKITEDKDLGYIYTYKLSKDLGSDRSVLKNVPQEDKPPEADKKSPFLPKGGLSLPGLKSDKQPEKPGTVTDDYLGLPNVPRSASKGEEAMKTDCFINAVVQIMAGPYWVLFNPKKHHIQFEKERIIQAAVWRLILAIHKVNKITASGKDIEGLRQILLDEGIVESMVLHEDASQVMIMLLAKMLDLQQFTIYIPGQGESEENMIEMAGGETLTDIAITHHCPVAALEERNTLIDPARFSFSVQTRRKADLTTAKPIPPEKIKGDEGEYTGGISIERFSGAGIIPVDIVNFSNFHQFLYKTYGGGSVETHLGMNDIQRIVNSPVKEEEGEEAQYLYIQSFTQKSRFTALPHVLTFYLKRFTQIDGRPKKDSGKFDMPENMVLVESNENGKTYKEYSLKAEAIHSGGIGGGHYTTNVKKKDQWYGFDDATVRKRDSIKADLDTGYIYTYILEGEYDVLPKGKIAFQEIKPQEGLQEIEGHDDLAIDFAHNLLIYQPAKKDLRHILDQLVAGPLGTARTKLGLQWVLDLKAMVEKIGVVTADNRKGLSQKILPVIKALEQLKKNLGVKDLRDAMKRQPTPQITIHLDFRAGNRKIKGYQEELGRQLALHQAYINNLPLDEWHMRLDLFNATKSERLGHILKSRSEGYQESMLDELVERARHLFRIRKTSTKKTRLTAILKDLEARQKTGDLSILQQLTKRVPSASAEGDISYYRDLIGRTDTNEANQPRWAKPGSQSRDRFVARMKKGWDPVMYSKTYTSKQSGELVTTGNIAVLHKPDQVAGGERFLPEVEPEDIENFIGSGKVNSDIGSAWGGKFEGKEKVAPGAAEKLRAFMLKTYPEARWALLLTNFKLVIRWSDDKTEDVGPAKKLKSKTQTSIADFAKKRKRDDMEKDELGKDGTDKDSSDKDGPDVIMKDMTEDIRRLLKKPKVEKEEDFSFPMEGGFQTGINKAVQTGLFGQSVKLSSAELLKWRQGRPWWAGRSKDYDPKRKGYEDEWRAWKNKRPVKK